MKAYWKNLVGPIALSLLALIAVACNDETTKTTDNEPAASNTYVEIDTHLTEAEVKISKIEDEERRARYQARLEALRAKRAELSEDADRERIIIVEREAQELERDAVVAVSEPVTDVARDGAETATDIAVDTADSATDIAEEAANTATDIARDAGDAAGDVIDSIVD